MMLGLIDAFGYAASGLTLATFAQRAMLPMRIMAIGANVCFIGYGAMGPFMPVLVLHVILLPINVIRLRTLVSAPETGQSRPHEDANNALARAGITSGLL
ncbi:hypothetical protein [Microvirga arabica]|uniref:hypothetical protein n=1 Tax=Microvirga arabica TaxID=1128671 RepID=UPI001939ED4A|nr:hypothetical protein [Microvirga arabica]MBM1170922.1 hypothetical protein [Microvirga arabica]